jgi:hypothetical protein
VELPPNKAAYTEYYPIENEIDSKQFRVEPFSSEKVMLL